MSKVPKTTDKRIVLSEDIVIDALTKYLSSQDMYKGILDKKYIKWVDAEWTEPDFEEAYFIAYIFDENEKQLELPFDR